MAMFSRRNTGARKLNSEEVGLLRQAYDKGETQGTLSRRFRISVGQVGRIVRGESWQGSAIARESSPPAPIDHSAAIARLLAVQASLTPAAANLLEGGDAPDETGGSGLTKLSTVKPDVT